jgi:hypothetical protein
LPNKYIKLSVVIFVAEQKETNACYLIYFLPVY